MEEKSKKVFSDNIADSKDDEQILRGILPKNFFAYRVYKFFRLLALLLFGISIIFFALLFIEAFNPITKFDLYKLVILGLIVAALICIILMQIVRIIFLKKAPFDDWVFEIAQKRLGTEVIFYDRHYIYIQYDRSGKEVDKREFVSEMSDKSINFSYFYVKTYVDTGFIQVECTSRQPIPTMARFSENDDKNWNIIPLGLTINNTTQMISPIGWYLNDKNIDDSMIESVPSTSILICGGTGCNTKHTPIPVYNSLLSVEDLERLKNAQV